MVSHATRMLSALKGDEVTELTLQDFKSGKKNVVRTLRKKTVTTEDRNRKYSSNVRNSTPVYCS